MAAPGQELDNCNTSHAKKENVSLVLIQYAVGYRQSMSDCVHNLSSEQSQNLNVPGNANQITYNEKGCMHSITG